MAKAKKRKKKAKARKKKRTLSPKQVLAAIKTQANKTLKGLAKSKNDKTRAFKATRKKYLRNMKKDCHPTLTPPPHHHIKAHMRRFGFTS